MALKAEKFPQNVQSTPIPFSLQMKSTYATISYDRLFCSNGNDGYSQVALGEYPMHAATKQNFSFQFNLQGNAYGICMGVSKNTTVFADDDHYLGRKEGEYGIVNRQGCLGGIYHNRKAAYDAFPGWTSKFQENQPVTMTLDTEKGELTLFDSNQVSLGTFPNEEFKKGVFYPACSVYYSASKVSMMKLTLVGVPVPSQTMNQPQQQQFRLKEKELENENALQQVRQQLSAKEEENKQLLSQLAYERLCRDFTMQSDLSVGKEYLMDVGSFTKTIKRLENGGIAVVYEPIQKPIIAQQMDSIQNEIAVSGHGQQQQEDIPSEFSSDQQIITKAQLPPQDHQLKKNQKQKENYDYSCENQSQQINQYTGETTMGPPQNQTIKTDSQDSSKRDTTQNQIQQNSQ